MGAPRADVVIDGALGSSARGRHRPRAALQRRASGQCAFSCARPVRAPRTNCIVRPALEAPATVACSSKTAPGLRAARSSAISSRSSTSRTAGRASSFRLHPRLGGDRRDAARCERPSRRARARRRSSGTASATSRCASPASPSFPEGTSRRRGRPRRERRQALVSARPPLAVEPGEGVTLSSRLGTAGR